MSRPQLCVTVTAPTMSELRRRRDEIAEADLIEMRLDTVSDPDVAGALAGRSCPVIVTCRPEWEGGRFRGTEDERRRLLGQALALGAEYVDIESRARFDDLLESTGGRRIILSYHDFNGVPADLGGLVQTMRSTGAEIVKVAVQARTLSDCVPLLEVGQRARNEPGLVLIGMGPGGLVTRVLAARFGSMWTYAGSLHQAGQVSARSLLGDYRFRTLSETSDLYGVVGFPISHSVSPAMHNAAFKAAGIDAVYLPLPAETADDFVTFGRALGIRGASITIPHKVTLLARVDEADAVARRVGAINTLRAVDDGRWVGTNTDVQGFLRPLAERVALGGLRASILGSGGAARAVALALASSGCRVHVHGRSREHAEKVAALTSTDAAPYPPERGSWDLLVNCTPVGMYPHVDESPMHAGDVTGGRCVYDLIYNPADTQLLRDAAQAGCQTIGGLEMLVAQAHEQFEWWTGVRPPAGVMREAAQARLAEFIRDEDYVV